MIQLTGPSRKEKYPQTCQGRGQQLPTKVGPMGLMGIGILHVNCGSPLWAHPFDKLPNCTSLPMALLLSAKRIVTKLIYSENHKASSTCSLVRGLHFSGYNKNKPKFMHIYKERNRYISSNSWVYIVNSKSGRSKKIECAACLMFWNQSRDWTSHGTEGKTPFTSSVNSSVTTSCSNSSPSQRFLVSQRPKAHMGDSSHLLTHRDLRPAVFYVTICREKQTGLDLHLHLSGLARASEKRAGWPKCAHDL